MPYNIVFLNHSNQEVTLKLVFCTFVSWLAKVLYLIQLKPLNFFYLYTCKNNNMNIVLVTIFYYSCTTSKSEYIHTVSSTNNAIKVKREKSKHIFLGMFLFRNLLRKVAWNVDRIVNPNFGCNFFVKIITSMQYS